MPSRPWYAFDMRRIFRPLFIAVGALTLIAGGVLAYNSNWMKIETVTLEIAPQSKQELLFQRINNGLKPQLTAYEGKYFWQVSLHQIYDLVAKDKRVSKVSVYREFPSRLRIEIDPRTPVLGFLSNDGRIYPVATDATLLPALTVHEAQDMPLLRGSELSDEPKLREMALELFDSLPADGAFRKRDVSEIVYTKKDGFGVYLNGSPAEVRMGDSDFGPKVSRVEKVLSYLESQNIKGRVIDARYNKKVVVRVRKAP
jgi:cell division septal protein FtsQ